MAQLRIDISADDGGLRKHHGSSLYWQSVQLLTVEACSKVYTEYIYLFWIARNSHTNPHDLEHRSFARSKSIT